MTQGLLSSWGPWDVTASHHADQAEQEPQCKAHWPLEIVIFSPDSRLSCGPRRLGNWSGKGWHGCPPMCLGAGFHCRPQGWRTSRNSLILLWHWSLVADLSLERTQATSGGLCAMSSEISQLQIQFLTRTVIPLFPDQQGTKPFGPVSVPMPWSFLLYPLAHSSLSGTPAHCSCRLSLLFFRLGTNATWCREGLQVLVAITRHPLQPGLLTSCHLCSSCTPSGDTHPCFLALVLLC